MSTSVRASDRRRNARRLIFGADLVLALFPPLYWLFDSGVASLAYVLASNTLIAISLFALWALRDRDEEAAS